MEIVEHPADVRRAFGSPVLENVEVVIAVRQVIAISEVVNDLQTKGIAPESNCLLEVRRSDADMNQC